MPLYYLRASASGDPHIFSEEHLPDFPGPDLAPPLEAPNWLSAKVAFGYPLDPLQTKPLEGYFRLNKREEVPVNLSKSDGRKK